MLHPAHPIFFAELLFPVVFCWLLLEDVLLRLCVGNLQVVAGVIDIGGGILLIVVGFIDLLGIEHNAEELGGYVEIECVFELVDIADFLLLRFLVLVLVFDDQCGFAVDVLEVDEKGEGLQDWLEGHVPLVEVVQGDGALGVHELVPFDFPLVV